MQTNLLNDILDTLDGKEANRILRSCVHCGFCTATCPTYQLLGDELDGPRGRIYLMKGVLEGEDVTEKTRTHLDRCLTCKSCETTCPSGVEYTQLLAITKPMVEKQVPRSFWQRQLRRSLLFILPHRHRFSFFLSIAHGLRPLLPPALKHKLPEKVQVTQSWPKDTAYHQRKVLMLEGCVQPSLGPNTNAAAAQVLSKLGISVLSITQAGCCGAVHHHLGEKEAAKTLMRRNIDAWWPQVEQGVEAIMTTGSACALELKEYGVLLADDVQYAQKATQIADLSKDISEILSGEDLSFFQLKHKRRIVFHAPCTLQHGLKQMGVVEQILSQLGYDLQPIVQSYLCCGSAGTYSILEAKVSVQLRDAKLKTLLACKPELIASANIGCIHHLSASSPIPIIHWIELLATTNQKP